MKKLARLLIVIFSVCLIVGCMGCEDKDRVQRLIKDHKEELAKKDSEVKSLQEELEKTKGQRDDFEHLCTMRETVIKEFSQKVSKTTYANIVAKVVLDNTGNKEAQDLWQIVYFSSFPPYRQYKVAISPK
jgi:peptidoglycan hydrolase CwlO-like protein